MLTPILCLAVLASPLEPARAAARQAASADAPAAKLSVGELDFGTVIAGALPAAKVVIENVGAAPLALLRVGVTCECAALHLSTAKRLNVPIDQADEGKVDLSLPPGQKATLEVRVDTTKLSAGPFEKRVVIVCNDPENGALSVPFKLVVQKPAAPARTGIGAAGHDEHAGHDHSAAEEAARAPSAGDAAPPVDPALAPKLDVDVPRIDFGTVYRGEILHQTVTLKNGGKSDLVINEIQNSCTCAASKLHINGRTIAEEEIKQSKRLGVLAPGEEAKLEVEMKTAAATTAGRDTEINKALRIRSNDPARPMLSIQLRAAMISPFTLEPARLDFGAVRKGQGAKRYAVLYSDMLGDFPVTGVTSPNTELLTASITKVETAPGVPPTWRIDAEISPAAPLGDFGGQVHVQVAHERVKEIMIPVNGRVEPNVSFLDNKPDDPIGLLDFERMTAGTAKTLELTIENGDPASPYVLKSAALSNVRPTSEGFTLETIEIEKGMKYRVVLTAPADMGNAKYFQGDVVLTADHADVPLHKVRFRGWIQAQ